MVAGKADGAASSNGTDQIDPDPLMDAPCDPTASFRESPLFQGASGEQLEALAGAARTVRFAAGQQIFAAGESAGKFFAIAAGKVHLYRSSPAGGEMLFQILGAGSLLAEAAMFLEPPCYPVAARASEETQLFAFPRQALLALCDAAPQVTRRLLTALSERLYQTVNRIEHLSLNNAGQRLVLYLLELRRHRSAYWINLPMDIDLPVSVAVLAGQLAMTPETLFRLLKKFREEGLISGKGRTLVLLSIEGLCARVGLALPSEKKDIPSMVGCCNLK